MLFNEYPYINLTDINLDWILKHIKDLETNLQDFVKLNTIKYADPIIWNITKQYETNTVVIDGNTGTAYLSVQPVPAGVALTNTDYWTVIFTLNLTTSNQNITFRDDGTNVVATFDSNTGDWILWNFYLYRVTQPISVNTAYVEGFNIERFSVELFIRDYINILSAIIGTLDDLNTTDKDSVVDAINSLVTIIGDLGDLETTDKDSVVDAINSLVTIIGDLGDLETTDKDSVVDAINEVIGNIGDLDSLKTADKDSAVDAINEIYDSIPVTETFWHNVKEEFGAVGDATTDDTTAIESAIAYMQTHKVGLYFPEGDYRITRKLAFDDNNNRWWVMRGAHPIKSVLRADFTTDTTMFDLIASGAFRECVIANFTFINANANTNVSCINMYRMTNSVIRDCVFRGFVNSINSEYSWGNILYNCQFREKSTAGSRAFLRLTNQSNTWMVEKCTFSMPQGSSNYAVSLSMAETQLSFKNCSFEYGNGFQMSNAADATAPLSVIDISDCYFEWMDGTCVKSDAGVDDIIENVTIEKCYFNARETTPPAAALDLRHINGIAVRDCYCVRYSDSMIGQNTGNLTGSYDFKNNTCYNIPVTKLSVHEEKGSAASAPTAGYHHNGEIVWSNAPSANAIGWICTAYGTPGTWTPIKLAT